MANSDPKPPEPKKPDGAVVELVLCNDTVNATATAYDADGEIMELPARIEIRPQFLSPNGLVGISRCKVVAYRGGVASEQSVGMLRLSGVNGKLQMEPILAQLFPKFMQPPEPPKPPKPADPPKDDKS